MLCAGPPGSWTTTDAVPRPCCPWAGAAVCDSLAPLTDPANGLVFPNLNAAQSEDLQGGTDVTTFSNGRWIFWTPLDRTAVGQDGVVPAVTVSGVPGYAYDLFFEVPGGFLDLHSVTALGDAILDHSLASGGTHINSTPAAVVVPY